MASARATSVNPQMLRWARERAGLSADAVAKRMDKPSDTIRAWEAGAGHPTYSQLEALAGCYRRPIALFFFPQPPDEGPVQQEFRTLPDLDAQTLEPDTLFALRDTHALQLSLRELSGGHNPTPRLITDHLRRLPGEPVEALARRTRDFLGVTSERQRDWSSISEAMRAWRDAVEGAGVFVFKRSFKQREISGFCITDPTFPVIVVNNSTPATRQIFTLLHELAHLLFGVSSIDKEDPGTSARLSPADRELETECNRFAAEVLIPADEFPWSDFRMGDLEHNIAAVADRFRVSREVVLRRLLDRGRVDRDIYASLTRRWAEEMERAERGSGGSWYANQAAYLGRAFLNLAFSRYWAGAITLAELAEHLRMKAANAMKLEEYLAKRG